MHTEELNIWKGITKCLLLQSENDLAAIAIPNQEPAMVPCGGIASRHVQQAD